MSPATDNACGTMRGYDKHGRDGTPRCRPCLDANAADCRARRARRAARQGLPVLVEPRPDTTEVCAEIEWLLRLGQGQHAILQAIGYLGRGGTLERRLQRAGRADLVTRLLRLETADA